MADVGRWLGHVGPLSSGFRGTESLDSQLRLRSGPSIGSFLEDDFFELVIEYSLDLVGLGDR